MDETQGQQEQVDAETPEEARAGGFGDYMDERDPDEPVPCPRPGQEHRWGPLYGSEGQVIDPGPTERQVEDWNIHNDHTDGLDREAD